MDYLGKGAPLMFGRVAHFQSVNHHQSISSDLRSSIERLFHVTKLAVHQEEIVYRLASEKDEIYAEAICRQMHDSAVARGCGISKREPAELIEKIKNGKAIIAINSKSEWVGFSYIEVYEKGSYVSNSGLIVSPEYRKHGVAWEIKQRIFDLSRTLYPTAKIFSITSGGAVMKMNSKLGFEPVPYAEITSDPKFWEGCKSCVNHAALLSKNCQNCFCTAMLFCPDPKSEM